MLYINNNNTNPYFNLACEEYFLKNFQEDIFMLWRNAPSIIIGKNQNTLSEINLDYVKANSIPVVRRLSGGGAVFHDLGNLNFTFISNNDAESFTNFRKFTSPILEVLHKLSINAEFSGRNDLTIEGKKFSGNAQYNYKNRVLHHGTLLFSSDITDLSMALKVKPSKFEGKAVKSVNSRVTNISSYLTEPLTILQFKEMIMQHIMSLHKGEELFEFSERDLKSIVQLTYEKYSTWEWNFGSSPNYSFTNEKKFASGFIEFNVNVDKGIMTAVKMYGDFFGKCDISDLENALTGVKHSEHHIRDILCSFNLNDYLMGITLENVIEGLTKPY